MKTRSGTSRLFIVTLCLCSALMVVGLFNASSIAPSQSSTSATTSTPPLTTIHSVSSATNITQLIESDVTANVTIEAFHSHHQKPYAVRTLPDDLVLNNFNVLLGYMFQFGSSATSISISSISSAHFSFSTNSCPTPSCGAYFEIGTSGTAPSRTDAALGAAYTPSGGNAQFPDTAENPTVTASPTAATCNTGATDYISGISGAQVITGTTTIQEVGLFLGGSVSAGSGSILAFHDTFAGISTVSGDSVAVNYNIDLSNAGMNNNLCELLALMFTGNIASAGSVSGTFTKTTGGTAGFYSWCSLSANVYTLATSSSCGNPSPTGQIAIGTSSTALSTSAYALGSIAGGYGTLTADAYPTSPGGTIYWTTSLTITGSHTITEAGFFIELSSNEYMFFRTIFSGIGQSSGIPFPMTLRLED